MKVIKRFLYLVWKIISSIFMAIIIALSILMYPIVSALSFLIKGDFSFTSDSILLKVIEWEDDLDTKFLNSCK